MLRSEDQLIRKLSVGKDCKEAKVLINLEIKPLEQTSSPNMVSIADGGGAMGKFAIFLRIKSRICKNLKKMASRNVIRNTQLIK